VINDLAQIIKEMQKEKEYKFVFGNKRNTYFEPYINSFNFERIKTFLDSSTYVSTQTEQKQYCNILDIGVVNNHYVMFGYSGTENVSSLECLTYRSQDNSHSILLIHDGVDDYQIEVSLIQIPTSLTELFEPVKALYKLLPELLVKEENYEVVSSYNSLFEKDYQYPWIVPQGLSYLKHTNLEKYYVCPMRRGVSYTLFLSEKGVYMMNGDGVFIVSLEDDVHDSLYNTVISGDWYENRFYGYDISIFCGQDVRKQSLIKRERYLYKINKYFPFCVPIKYYSVENAKSLLNVYDGVIFSPIKANYTNNRTYIYQHIKNISIYFKVSQNYLRYKTYTLKTGKEEEVFTGNTEYPFFNTIPLVQEDRKFIGTGNECVIEFKWDSNSFVPVSYSNTGCPTSTVDAKNIWTYINEHIDFD